MVRAALAGLIAVGIGAAALTLLQGWLGEYAEAATLGVVGLALVGTSQVMSGKASSEVAPGGSAKPLGERKVPA